MIQMTKVPKPNAAERELVLLIFRTYVKEQSFRAVAQIINKKAIVRNSMYRGEMLSILAEIQ